MCVYESYMLVSVIYDENPISSEYVYRRYKICINLRRNCEEIV